MAHSEYEEFMHNIMNQAASRADQSVRQADIDEAKARVREIAQVVGEARKGFEEAGFSSEFSERACMMFFASLVANLQQ